MSYRAAVVLLNDKKVALIERYRQGKHYFTFPGGHVEDGESPEQAALREAEEELGLRVTIQRLLAVIWWQGHPQYYYLVEADKDVLGVGKGEEMVGVHPEKGSYTPIWMNVDDLLYQPVLPRPMAEFVVRGVREGWPLAPLILPET